MSCICATSTTTITIHDRQYTMVELPLNGKSNWRVVRKATPVLPLNNAGKLGLSYMKPDKSLFIDENYSQFLFGLFF